MQRPTESVIRLVTKATINDAHPQRRPAGAGVAGGGRRPPEPHTSRPRTGPLSSEHITIEQRSIGLN